MDPGSHKAPSPFDLSKATELKDLGFQLDIYTEDVQWITATLQTATSPNLRRISIVSPMAFDPIEETTLQEWRDLDRLLVELWTSRSIRPEIKFLYGGENMRRSLLPELASRVVS
jgi:hypothetical protein